MVQKMKLIKSRFLYLLLVRCAATQQRTWLLQFLFCSFSELAAQLSASCPGEFLPPVLILFALGALVSSHSACLQTKTTSRE